MVELNMIRETLCTELKKYNTLKSINRAELDTIHTLTDTIKNIDKIKKLESETSEYDLLSEEDKEILQRAVEIMNR